MGVERTVRQAVLLGEHFVMQYAERKRSRQQKKQDLNTVWRKKNAFFSNNCTFVYFQYKKIMLTPKQPEINAVLITYTDYSITENYIGKMASFRTHVRSLSSKFCITFTKIFCGTVAISSRMETFRSSTVRGFRT